MRNYSHDRALAPSAFAAVLSEVFRGEPWDVIEPYAARAWSQLQMPQPWEDIREAVLQAFTNHGKDAALS